VKPPFRAGGLDQLGPSRMSMRMERLYSRPFFKGQSKNKHLRTRSFWPSCRLPEDHPAVILYRERCAESKRRSDLRNAQSRNAGRRNKPSMPRLKCLEQQESET